MLKVDLNCTNPWFECCHIQVPSRLKSVGPIQQFLYKWSSFVCFLLIESKWFAWRRSSPSQVELSHWWIPFGFCIGVLLDNHRPEGKVILRCFPQFLIKGLPDLPFTCSQAESASIEERPVCSPRKVKQPSAWAFNHPVGQSEASVVVEDAGAALFVVKLGVVVAAVTKVAVDLVVLVEVERVVLLLVASGVVVWICLEMPEN